MGAALKAYSLIYQVPVQYLLEDRPLLNAEVTLPSQLLQGTVTGWGRMGFFSLFLKYFLSWRIDVYMCLGFKLL